MFMPIIGCYYNTIKVNQDVQRYVDKCCTPEQHIKIDYTSSTVYFIESEWRTGDIIDLLVSAGIEFTYVYREYRQKDDDRLAEQSDSQVQ